MKAKKFKNLKRALALVLVLCMAMSGISFTSFAQDKADPLDNTQEDKKDAQIVVTGETDAVVASNRVWATKTAQVTDEEGRFLITLGVKTKDKIQPVSETENANVDVVIVFDSSSSMQNSSRFTNAISASKAFAQSFLGNNPDGSRRIAVVDYNSETTSRPFVSTYADVEAQLNSIPKDKKGTFTQAGLIAGYDLIKDSEASYKFIILLTDGEANRYYMHDKEKNVSAGEIISVGSGSDLYKQTKYYSDFNSTVRGWEITYNDVADSSSVYNKEAAYSAVSQAKMIKDAGIEIYGIGIGITSNNRAKYVMYNSVTHVTGSDNTPSYSGYYFDYNEKTGTTIGNNLSRYFVTIANNITIKTHAWLVEDTMGPGVVFDGFADANVAVESGGKITWNLKAPSISFTGGTDGEPYNYTMQYYVKLKNPGYKEGVNYDTNSKATLSYSFEDVTYTEDVVENGHTIHYKGDMILSSYDITTPVVQGYQGEFSFTKSAKNGTPITGAEFALYSADGKTEYEGSWAHATSSGGTVSFSNIPFGNYVMKEKTPADGFDRSSEVYNVTVSYDKTTVTGANGAAVGADTKYYNLYSQGTKSITVNKVWVDGGKESHDAISVKLLQTKDGETSVFPYNGQESTSISASDNWTKTFTGLPAKSEITGAEIAYTVTEAAISGYTAAVSASGNTFTITNTISDIDAETEVTLTKTWIGGAGDVEVELYRQTARMDEREKVGKYTFDDSCTIDKLPKYDEYGYEYTYFAEEINVPEGFTSIQNGFDFTNVVNQKTTSVSGNKTWKVGSSDYTATFRLSADYKGFVAPAAQTLNSKGETQTYTFADLPVYLYTMKDDTETTAPDSYSNVKAVREIKYTVSEDEISGLTQAQDGYNFTNALTGTQDITVEKIWVDDGPETRPEEVTLVLAGNDGESYEATFKADADSFTKTFTVPKYDGNGYPITYTLTESGAKDGIIPGFTSGSAISEYEYAVSIDGYTVTNTLNGGERTITANKVWNDGDNEQKARPASVDLVLVDSNKKEYKPTSVDGWTYTFEALPIYKDGKVLTYTVKEVGETDGQFTVEGGLTYVVKYDQENYTVTNTIKQDETELTVTKIWVDGGNKNGLRKPVTMVLSADGIVIDEQELTAANAIAGDADTWTYTFTPLPKYNNGKLITYTVAEKAAPGNYTMSVYEANVIINTLNRDTVELTASKTWVTDEDVDKLTASFQLQSKVGEGEWIADESENGTKSITGNGKSVSFSSLPKYTEDYSVISYRIVEINVPDTYTNATYHEDGSTAYSFVNTKKIVNKVFSAEKNFVGPEYDGAIYAGLFRDGVKVATVALQAPSWKADFGSQPLTDVNYKAYTYTVRELANADDDEGFDAGETSGEYTVSYGANGVITNTVNQKYDVSFTVTKDWAELVTEGVVTSETPAVKVQLGYIAGGFHAYGEPVELSSANNWTYTFTGLPRYQLPGTEGIEGLTGGAEIVYEVRELDGETILSDGATVRFGEDQNYIVSYAEGGKAITNTYDPAEKYYYRVDKEYTATVDGRVVVDHETVIGKLNTVLPDEDRDISIGDGEYDVNAGEFKKYGDYTYSFTGSDPEVSVYLDEANHEYVILLIYKFDYNTAPHTHHDSLPGSNTEEEDIAEEEVPLAEPEIIEEPDVPLAEAEEAEAVAAEEFEVFDEDVPLADVPSTSDNAFLWFVLSLMAALGLAVLTIAERKSRQF